MITLNLKKPILLFISFIVFFLPFPLILGQTHTVNYSIPDWNASGSFTFETGSFLNQITNKTESNIKIIMPDGKSLEINSIKIDKIINILETNIDKIYKGGKYSVIKQSSEDAIKNLKEFKTRLINNSIVNDKKQLEKISNSNNLNWSYTIETIRGIQVYVTGTVD